MPNPLSASATYPFGPEAFPSAALAFAPKARPRCGQLTADPALTSSITSGSLVNGDSLTGSLTRDPGETVAGSPYAIKQGTLAANSNYSLTFNGANLTITPRPITVTADDKSKVQGATDPALTYQKTDGSLGFNDTLGGVLSGSLTRDAGESIGSYPIKQGTVAAANNNYTLSFNPGTFKILYADASTQCLGAAGHTILQPINKASETDSVFKLGSTVPAKFRVCDANGNSIGTPGVVQSFKLVKTISGTEALTVNEDVISTTPDTSFRWSSADQQWIYNISTKNLAAGKTYVYQITLNDGTTIDFQFGIRK